jgi:hypothetical protein
LREKLFKENVASAAEYVYCAILEWNMALRQWAGAHPEFSLSGEGGGGVGVIPRLYIIGLILKIML